MSESRQNLINQLVAKNHSATKLFSSSRLWVLWSVLAWALVTALMFVVAPFRSDAIHQLSHSPHFAIETLMGVAVSLLLGVFALRLAVPGLRNRFLLMATFTLAALWLLSYVYGINTPALEPSMHGKREHCTVEVLVLGLPSIILGFYLVSRGYVSHWLQAGLAVGFASALIPAVLMQLACMYEPMHVLKLHLAPTILVGAGAGVVAMVIQRLTRSKPKI